jgi:hypothetical protein
MPLVTSQVHVAQASGKLVTFVLEYKGYWKRDEIHSDLFVSAIMYIG